MLFLFTYPTLYSSQIKAIYVLLVLSMAIFHVVYSIFIKGGLGSEVDEVDGGGDKPRTYRIAFTRRAGPRPCTVEGCIDRALTRTAMRVHI